MKKGTKVRYNLLGSGIARIDHVYDNGTADIKYQGDKYVVTVSIDELEIVK